MTANHRNGNSSGLVDYLTPEEMDLLLKAAKAGRHGTRDHAMVLLAYQHGLRVSELTGLRRDALDLNRARLKVQRLKGSQSGEHPVSGTAMRALRRYLATRKDSLPWLFVSERGTQLTRQQAGNIVRNAGKRIGLKVWPHMLRHACGFKLCNENVNTRIVQEYLGHKNIMHTVRYTKMAGKAFEGLWQ